MRGQRKPRLPSPPRSPQCFCPNRRNIRQLPSPSSPSPPSLLPRNQCSAFQPRSSPERMYSSTVVDHNYNGCCNFSDSSYGHGEYTPPSEMYQACRPTKDTKSSRPCRNSKDRREPLAETRYHGFPCPAFLSCIKKGIPPELNYASKPARQARRPPTPPPLPPKSYYTCSYSSSSYDDEDISEDMDMCSCACYDDEEHFIEEESFSVYDSVAEDTCCMCSNNNNIRYSEWEASGRNKTQPKSRYQDMSRVRSPEHSRQTSPASSVKEEDRALCLCRTQRGLRPSNEPQNVIRTVVNKESATQSIHSSFQNDPPVAVPRNSETVKTPNVSKSSGPSKSNEIESKHRSSKGQDNVSNESKRRNRFLCQDPRCQDPEKYPNRVPRHSTQSPSPIQSQPHSNTQSNQRSTLQGSIGSGALSTPLRSDERKTNSPKISRMSADNPMLNSLYDHLSNKDGKYDSAYNKISVKTGERDQVTSDVGDPQMTRRMALKEDYRTSSRSDILLQHENANVDLDPEEENKPTDNNKVITRKSCMKDTCPFRKNQHQSRYSGQNLKEDSQRNDKVATGGKSADPVRDDVKKSCQRKTCKFRQSVEKPEDNQEKPRASSSAPSSKREGCCKCSNDKVREPETCAQKSCDYCKELLRKLQQHKEAGHEKHESETGSGLVEDGLNSSGKTQEIAGPEPAGIRECVNPKCRYKKYPERQPQPSKQLNLSDSNQEASTTATSSKPSSEEAVLDLDSDPDDQPNKETKSTHSPTSVCLDKSCKPRQKQIEFNEDDYRHHQIGEGKLRHCYHPQCALRNKKSTKTAYQNTYTQNAPTFTGDQNAYQYNSRQNESSESYQCSIAEMPTLKEHIDLKEFAFRSSPRSSNVLGPQEQRVSLPYYPPVPSTAFSTNFPVKRMGGPTISSQPAVTHDNHTKCPTHGVTVPCSTCGILNCTYHQMVETSFTKHQHQSASNTLETSNAPSDLDAIPSHVFYSSARQYSGLPPVQEVSKEESETTCETISSKDSKDSKHAVATKCEPTQISTNKASTTMTYNVGVQYPSSMEVEKTVTKNESVQNTIAEVLLTKEKKVPAGGHQANKPEVKRSDFKKSSVYKTMTSKSRRCLVHSYPLANRKISPNRATSPKI